MTKLPNARLCVHPRGVRHMADPSRLIESTIAVYGAEHARRVYGDIVPVAPERILVTEEGTVIELNGRRLSFIDTPGHARHHVCIHDARSNHCPATLARLSRTGSRWAVRFRRRARCS
jgi:glyoxylase-like metal-dependent hydrolase (beta-lactamase superfamily II)